MMRLRYAAAVLVVLVSSACASSGQRKQSGYQYYRSRHTQASSAHPRLGKIPHTDVPIVVNDRVMAWIDYFTGANRDRFERYLQRSGRYMTLFRQTLRQHGLPEDLVFVALIESGFSNRATSVAAAAGTWQFIQSTGRHYGLGINTWIDERRDPEKAVDAAARYLKDLYREFGDWYLAIAGYNAGEGRVREAIARYGTKDFWELTAPGKNVFRAETRDYVPKFIAAAIIAKSPEQFGFRGVQYQAPWQYEHARVDSQTDMQVVADCAGVSLDDILDLNPDLRSGMTPPGSHEVRLPVGTGRRFHAAFARVPRSERVRIAYHTVERRESLPQIARRYGVSVRELMAANDIRRAKDLHRGQQLLIPRLRGRGVTVPTVEVASHRPLGELATPGAPEVLIRAPVALNRRGPETAQPAVAAVSRENTAEQPAPIQGLREGRPAVYRVRHGDSLSDIAARFGVTVANLREWNALTGHRKNRLLRGQRLQVAQPAGTPAEAVTVEPVASTSSDLLAMQPPEGAEAATAPDIATVAAGRQAPPDEVVAAPDVATMPEPPAAPVLPKREKPVRVSSHTVRAGETLAVIAKRHDTTVAKLQRLNQLKGGTKIRPGQKLTVAGRPGESDHLAMAARSARGTWSGSETPTPGAAERLIRGAGGAAPAVAPRARPAPKAVAQSRAAQPVRHKVRPGDTIWDLSRLYKVSPEQIKAWNNIPHGVIKPGQTLTIHPQSSRS